MHPDLIIMECMLIYIHFILLTVSGLHSFISDQILLETVNGYYFQLLNNKKQFIIQINFRTIIRAKNKNNIFNKKHIIYLFYST